MNTRGSEVPSRVDEAALGSTAVGAVVALALGQGPYGWLSTGIGFTLAFLLSAYYRPLLTPPRNRLDSYTRALAFGAVAGLLVAMILAWPIQFGFCQSGQCYRTGEPNPADPWIGGVWGVVGLALAAAHRKVVPPGRLYSSEVQ